MTKQELIQSIKSAYETSSLRNRTEKGTEEFSIMCSKAYGVFNRYSNSTLNSMYTKAQLQEILDFVLSQVVVEEELVQENVVTPDPNSNELLISVSEQIIEETEHLFEGVLEESIPKSYLKSAISQMLIHTAKELKLDILKLVEVFNQSLIQKEIKLE